MLSSIELIMSNNSDADLPEDPDDDGQMHQEEEQKEQSNSSDQDSSDDDDNDEDSSDQELEPEPLQQMEQMPQQNRIAAESMHRIRQRTVLAQIDKMQDIEDNANENEDMR
jgi:hypothetical protein